MGQPLADFVPGFTVNAAYICIDMHPTFRLAVVEHSVFPFLMDTSQLDSWTSYG